jgi:nicotinamide mononucleotide transporter
MSVMDWIGFVTGVVCVFLIVREKDINWPIGLLNSVALLVVFWTQKLYAQAGLQAFYVVECAYGWRMWTRKTEGGIKVIRIGTTRLPMTRLLIAIGIFAAAVFHQVFKRTGDPAPFWDSIITVASLVAEYMLCLKLIEAWAVYFFSDLIALVLFGYLAHKATTLEDTRSMQMTFATYLCFTFLCVWGLREWLRRHGQRLKTHVPSLAVKMGVTP